MDLNVLDTTLRHLGIPMSLISLGRATDQTWCVVPTAGGWETYWAAGEVHHARVVLPDESAACYHLLGRLVHDQMLAGEFELPG